jgi:hypothetical protein
MKTKSILSIPVLVLLTAILSGCSAPVTHVYEVVEETFTARNTYDNPYTEVDLWVSLSGPGGSYKIPAFWDGGDTFRVRLVATAPGTWTWSTGKKTGDRGLDNKKGSFEAIAWEDSELEENPNRRGFIRVAENQRTLEYADGTPFFYTGDTWWSMLTGIYAWDSDEGLSGISIQKAIDLRKAQGFNGINIIACFPSDVIKGIWDRSTHGKKVAEDGTTPFEIADPEDPAHGVDFTRINPGYWQQADLKMEYLWENGFAPFMESVRRHEQWYSENEEERDAFVNYIRYLWARYGCYNMIFSWVHWDWIIEVLDEWKSMVNMAYDQLGEMPYGQPRTAMAWGSSLTTWCVEPGAVPLDAFDLHNVSNKNRDYVMHSWLREIYNHEVTKPGINIEPFYAGWGARHHRPSNGLNDCTKAQFQMYGSVLNGGLAGHAWGDTYYAGVATNPADTLGVSVEPGDPHVNGFNHWCAASMGILKDFILDPGHDYSLLVPATLTHLADTLYEWRVLALYPDQSLGLGFIAANYPKTDLVNLIPEANYGIEWWDIDNGGWINDSQSVTDSTGKLIFPDKPDSRGWAYRIRLLSE